MKKKLIELAEANEKPMKKNIELLGKLKKANNQMIELEKERRADKNQIKAFKIQLHKTAKHAQTKQIICVTEEEEEEDDRSKPVEEKDHCCREEQPGTEKGIPPNVERESRKEEGIGRIPRHRGSGK
ncbi:hypothetical protein ACLB2K_064428 [Fragaria x ananassa]